MITLENFGENNREKRIGNSLYRICKDEYRELWYIFEIYNDVSNKKETAIFASGERNSRLDEIINKFNQIEREKEIIPVEFGGQRA